MKSVLIKQVVNQPGILINKRPNGRKWYEKIAWETKQDADTEYLKILYIQIYEANRMKMI